MPAVLFSGVFLFPLPPEIVFAARFQTPSDDTEKLPRHVAFGVSSNQF
jgi:hypothetical protein